MEEDLMWEKGVKGIELKLQRVKLSNKNNRDTEIDIEIECALLHEN